VKSTDHKEAEVSGPIFFFSDSINIKILNAGAWARSSERVTVSLPLELEDYIPEVEDFYKKKHSGRKLQWYHHMSNGTVCIICRVQFMGEIYIVRFLMNTLRKLSDPKACLNRYFNLLPIFRREK
jgi:hypothetical protein